MNLIAVSGAIFKTLVPLPRQSDVRPPSCIICLKPPTRLMRCALEEWTWNKIKDIHFLAHSKKIEKKKYQSPSHILPAWRLSFCPKGRSQCGKRPLPRHQPRAVSTSPLSSSPPLWTHLGWWGCRRCLDPGGKMNRFTQVTFICVYTYITLHIPIFRFSS